MGDREKEDKVEKAQEEEVNEPENKVEASAEEKLDKAIDELVNDFIDKTTNEPEAEAEVKVEAKGEEVQKADKKDKPGDEDASRGGKDLIKNEDEKKKKKMKDKDMDDLKDNSMKYSKKSHEVDEDEYRAFNTWKEEQALEKARKEKEATVDDIRKAVSDEYEEKFSKVGEIMKALHDQNTEIKKQLEDIGSQASRVRKSAKDVAAVEKSFDGSEEGEGKEVTPAENKLQKSKVLQTLTKLCKSRAIDPEDVTIFETSGQLTPRVREALEQFESNKE